MRIISKICNYWKVIALLVLLPETICAQQIRFDNLKEQFNKKNLFRMSGGVSANTVLYNGDSPGRQAFMWVLSGNINFNIYQQFNIPFSYNLNNLGGNYTYPTLPNRLSLHPSYKWVTGHIGDVSMSFSPYTLNGHQFTGVGVELAPEKLPFKFAVMYGRLIKATAYDPESRLSTAAYKRMGYGMKLRYEKEKAAIGMTFLRAKDDEHSLSQFDSMPVLPQSNLALSWDGTFKLPGGLSLYGEFGLSFMTRDNRLQSGSPGWLRGLFDKNSSTVRYYALKTGFNYQLRKNVIGFGYERIEPGYQTLGAYYFTNDLENFTVNFTRPFFQDKLTLALNAGMQHDNLGGGKREQTNRWVGSINLNYVPGEKLSASFSYSTFQSYTNIRSPFDRINETTQYDNLDTLAFTQLSQNMNLDVAYSFGNAKTCSQNLNLCVSYQEAADKRGGIIHPGSASRFYNVSGVYGLLLVPRNIQFTVSANMSYNTVGSARTLMCGPSLGMSTRFFEKKVISGLSCSFNSGFSEGEWTNSVFNIRWNAGWQFLKKHSTSLVVSHQNRNVVLKSAMYDFTVTFNYAYRF